MSLLVRRQSFGPSCPNGGIWYACASGSKFVGCCNSEPCENGCPAGNLEPASFNPSFYGRIPDQECSSGSWHTCSLTDPPFLGCCTTNPCQPGLCPIENLKAGFLSNDPATAAAFLPPASRHTPVGAIVGGVIGGLFALGIAVSLVYFRMKSLRSSRLHQGHIPLEQSLKGTPTELGPLDDSYKSPPPKYSKTPSSAHDSNELVGSPGHKRHASELSAISPPVELDAGEGVNPDRNRRWTQSTMRSEITQPSGLGISHAPLSLRFSLQSRVSEEA